MKTKLHAKTDVKDQRVLPLKPERLASAALVVDVVPVMMRLIRQAVRKGGTMSVPQLRVLGFVAQNPGSGISEVSAALDVTAPTAQPW